MSVAAGFRGAHGFGNPSLAVEPDGGAGTIFRAGKRAMGLVGMLLAVGMLIALAYRGWSILLLAPMASLLVAAFAREPVLAHWTQTFMSSTAEFIGQFFPLFLLGALFGKLMDDSGSVKAIAHFIVERRRRCFVLPTSRAA